MKKFLLFFICISLFLPFCHCASAQTVSTEIPKQIDLRKNGQNLRVLTYNIRACRGLDDSFGLNPELAGDIITSINPDVAGIQEVDRNNSRSGERDQIHDLGEMTGLHSYYGKAIDFAGGEYGIGVLSAEPAVSVRTVPLPGREEGRVLIEIELNDFVLFNTHLSLTPESRAEAADLINREATHFRKPIILTGDMNVSGDDEIVELFGEQWTVLSPNEASFPADKPKQRLDYILMTDPTGTISVNSKLWTESVQKSGVVPTIASDHRPVFIDLDLEKIKSAVR